MPKFEYNFDFDANYAESNRLYEESKKALKDKSPDFERLNKEWNEAATAAGDRHMAYLKLHRKSINEQQRN